MLTRGRAADKTAACTEEAKYGNAGREGTGRPVVGSERAAEDRKAGGAHEVKTPGAGFARGAGDSSGRRDAGHGRRAPGVLART
jgi:hypothetical protein